jgi:hypothetical protein
MAEYVEKQILVKTPVTTNGTNPAIGDDGRVIYKETILSAGARKPLEAINKTLPDQLKHRIEDIVPTSDKPAKNEKA